MQTGHEVAIRQRVGRTQVEGAREVAAGEQKEHSRDEVVLVYPGNKLPAIALPSDAETGQPPRVDGVRGVAYMSLSDADLPPYQADVVFRDRSATVIKYTPDGDLVCPYEQGLKPKTKITCSSCRYCFSTETRTRREHKGRVPLQVVV